MDGGALGARSPSGSTSITDPARSELLRLVAPRLQHTYGSAYLPRLGTHASPQ